METHNPITFFARTNFRNQHKLFGIKQADRRAHIWVIGKTGTGKSSLLVTFIRSDLETGHGFALLDPHGDLVERVHASIPLQRRADVVYFNVPDLNHLMGFNPLAGIAPEKRAMAASGILDCFKKIWHDSWGPRMEHILRNALLALLDRPESTLADILRLLDDKAFRKVTAVQVYNPQVRDFWLREYESYPPSFRREAIVPVQNKVGAFLTNPLLNRIVTQPQSTFDIRNLMDTGKILLVNLSKGKIGEDTASLLGSLLVASINTAALSRADMPEEERQDFSLYLDEFHTFTTLSLVTMLAELRKYHVGLVLAHQYLAQLDPSTREALVGTIGSTVCFRVGASDAEILAHEFSPEVSLADLVHLPNHHVYVRLMVDGVVSRPFSAKTLSRWEV